MFILGLTELLGLQAQAAEVGFDDGEQLRVHRRVPADCCKYFSGYYKYFHLASTTVPLYTQFCIVPQYSAEEQNFLIEQRDYVIIYSDADFRNFNFKLRNFDTLKGILLTK